MDANKYLELLILAQALTDVLRAELGLQEIGGDDFEELATAYVHVARYPTIRKRLAKKAEFNGWLQRVEDVLNE